MGVYIPCKSPSRRDTYDRLVFHLQGGAEDRILGDCTDGWLKSCAIADNRHLLAREVFKTRSITLLYERKDYPVRQYSPSLRLYPDQGSVCMIIRGRRIYLTIGPLYYMFLSILFSTHCQWHTSSIWPSSIELWWRRPRKEIKRCKMAWLHCLGYRSDGSAEGKVREVALHRTQCFSCKTGMHNTPLRFRNTNCYRDMKMELPKPTHTRTWQSGVCGAQEDSGRLMETAQVEVTAVHPTRSVQTFIVNQDRSLWKRLHTSIGSRRYMGSRPMYHW